MRLEATTVVIEPRSVGACLDLALLFCRRHAGSLAAPTLAFAAAGALFAFLVASWSEGALWWSAAFFFAASPLLGAVVVMGSGRAVFGEPFAPIANLRAQGWRLLGFVFHTAVARLVIAAAGLPCFFLTSLPVAVGYGFFPEVYLLEQTETGRLRGRIWELVQGRFGILFGRAVVLIGFAAGATVTLFLLVDQSARVLLAWPLVLGRLGRHDGLEAALQVLATHPPAAAVMAALAWLVYPIARLAWFFCYLDVRILKEAWDLELDFRVEARRLAGLSA